jgi:hypothetical protein
MLSRITWLAASVALGICLAPAEALDVSWHVVAGGGGSSSNSQYTLSGTAGQAAASAPGALTSTRASVTSGYWVIVAPVCASFARADFNCDCVIDYFDLLLFQACFEGPAISYASAGLPASCTLLVNSHGYVAADLDRDGDVDQRDFAIFQRCYSGPNAAADPDCGN